VSRFAAARQCVKKSVSGCTMTCART
jgi:hypothetical protein